ncbi:heme o synthase [Chryseobacterium camelliae]|uniref:Protoheme IX farnesyltransferase n=1 Tax=Chryseobacterium camelliae TaxID=1265445 RepID=A0ABU0TDS1_9FLAO|nr:heme o synthase [Chryseobacterium camelliae]MDQ1095227.1 protoheme IX farnesyltransferase [Chryseobacterium camelliae]
MKVKVKDYYHLSKPGIVKGNLMAVCTGFFYSAQLPIHWIHFFFLILGSSLIISSACIFNNMYDRDIDELMKRTQYRSTIFYRNPLREILFSAIFIFCAGVIILWKFTTVYTALAGVAGFFCYLILYSVFFKRKHYMSTEIGAIAGSFPPLMGYFALKPVINGDAVLLFLIYFFWQVPHTYAIALYRKAEYDHAKIPLFPLVKGISKTKIHLFIYISLYILSCVALFFSGKFNILLSCLFLSFCTVWLLSVFNIKKTEEQLWAKKVFLLSLYTMLLLSVTVFFNFILVILKN